MLDRHDAIPSTTVTADRGQGVSSAQAPSEQSSTQKFIKALRMLQRLKETDADLEDRRCHLLHDSHNFMKGSVKHLVQLLMDLSAHRYSASQRPKDPLKWDQKAISHQGEIVRAGQPRDIRNYFLFCVLHVMKLGIGTIPAAWSRMSNFQKNHLQDKSSSSRLRCYEKGADIVEALLGLCTVNNPYMSGA